MEIYMSNYPSRYCALCEKAVYKPWFPLCRDHSREYKGQLDKDWLQAMIEASLQDYRLRCKEYTKLIPLEALDETVTIKNPVRGIGYLYLPDESHGESDVCKACGKTIWEYLEDPSKPRDMCKQCEEEYSVPGYTKIIFRESEWPS
jgi:hypothetical protein